MEKIAYNAVCDDAIRPIQITINEADGTIEEIEKAEQTPNPNYILFPGFIDIHVHAREFPKPSASSSMFAKWEAACRKETFQTAGLAAINGGVVLLGAMPNDAVPPDNVDAYEQKKRLSRKSACPVVVYGAITKNSEPWADIPYKLYLDKNSSSVNFATWREAQSVLARYKNCRLFFHAEDPELLQLDASNSRSVTRPPQSEVQAVENIIEATEKFGLKSHICHISTRSALEKIIEHNRGSSRKITTEVTPHHLFYSFQAGQIYSPFIEAIDHPELLECNPPIRTEENRQFLLDCLKAGSIDVLASDHAPHTFEDKKNGAPGMPHLDTLGLFAAFLINRAGFTPSVIARVMSSRPAEFFLPDLPVPYGKIQVGHAASFTILDITAQSKLTDKGIEGRGAFKTKCGWSPFAGFTFPGNVYATYVLGKKMVG